jgi:hypothetical protein
VANRAEEYRRRARECLEVAHAFRAGKRRTILLQMAQVWQRLAEEQETTAQQQQQVPPKDDDKKD